MSVSNVFYETISFPPAIPAWPQFRAPHQEHHFDGQNIMLLDSHETLAREKIQFFNSNSHIPKGFDSCEVTTISQSSCLYGLICGIATTFLFKNPLLLFLGLSECFPRASAQQKVGNEFQVNTYISSDQRDSSVASFSNGNFVVTWQSDAQDGDVWGVYGQLFDGNGTKIGSEFQANTFTANYQHLPSVASLADSNFVVTWASDGQDGSGMGVYGQLFDGNGSKIGSEFRVNTYTTNRQGYPSVASFSNGNFVVTWTSTDQDGSGDGVYGQLFDGNSTKIGNEFRANTYTFGWQEDPSVASLTDGNFIVTWTGGNSQDSSGDGVYGQLFDGNSTKIGSEFQANSYTIDAQSEPSVASLADGNLVVTWHSKDQDGDAWGVYGQLFNENGSKIGSEFRANSYTANNQLTPSVASFSNGNFVVTWTSTDQDGSNYGVYGQLFDGNGAKIGSEFRVNTYTTNHQRYPSVASFSNGNFVVTWHSYGQDGSSNGVYGQIFNDFLVSSTTRTTTTTSSTTSSVSSSTSVPRTTKTTFSTTSSISSSTSVPSTTKTTSSTTSSVSSSTSVPSTTKTTSSTTSSVSSSSMSAIGRTRSSVNPSRSWTTVLSTTRPISTSNSRTTLSATSDPSNRFSWIWFLLGGVGVVSCLGLTGYFIFKSRKKDGDVHAFELGKREQTDDSTEMHYQRTSDHVTQESHYQRTPDFVTAGAGEETHYQRTPDFVTAGAGEETHYQRTPDFVTAGAGEETHYQRTPDFVTAGNGRH